MVPAGLEELKQSSFGEEYADTDAKKIQIKTTVPSRYNSQYDKHRKHRPSLDLVFGMQGNATDVQMVLFDHMKGRKTHKQRTLSNNDEQLLGSNQRTSAMVHQSTMNAAANPEQSHLHSKRSETSHEVWNAQSSH